MKKYLFPALFTASLLASWQGLSVGYAACESGSEKNVSDLYPDLREIYNTDCPSLCQDASSGINGAEAQSIEKSQSIPDLQAQWTLENIIDFSSARLSSNILPVLVAVLDTGIDRYHDELIGKIDAEINFTNSSNTDDIYGHGTSIAGIIAANANDGSGIAGVALESRLLNVKVADDNGKCQISALAEGTIWAVDHGAKVINISIELKDSAVGLKEAIDYAWNKGAIIVAAAGNDGGSSPVYPACYGNCLAVTAIQDSGKLAPLANYGEWVNVAAPGLKIYSTLPHNRYGYNNGTSYAAAYVSGLAAILFSMVTDTNGNGRLNDEVRQAIENGLPWS